MEDYGGWERPAFYPRPGETEEDAVRREVLAVRGAVGILDASPLGKIRVAGRDAAPKPQNPKTPKPQNPKCSFM